MPLPFSEQCPCPPVIHILLCFSRARGLFMVFSLLMSKLTVLKSNYLYEFCIQTQLVEVRVTEIFFTVFLEIEDSDLPLCVEF